MLNIYDESITYFIRDGFNGAYEVFSEERNEVVADVRTLEAAEAVLRLLVG